MRIGLIGTGAIARLHARVYATLGFPLRACTDIAQDKGRAFAAEFGAEFIEGLEDICRHPDVDVIDVCTFPDVRLQPVELAAAAGKAVQVQKPMAVDLATARKMIDVAARAGVRLGVVSQHRYDDAFAFLAHAIHEGRLGKLIQCDAYVKWFRSAEYYSRPIKGSWAVEGGGALINQAIHQVDLLRWLAGPVQEIFAVWQLGALHKIESEDVVTAILKFSSGATGVIQASTALWPGYPERVELHGTKGTAIVTGDRLTTWDVQDDRGEAPPLAGASKSGASDPMAISLEPFERQFRAFADAVRTGSRPPISGEDGYQALEVVDGIYRSCREQSVVRLS